MLAAILGVLLCAFTIPPAFAEPNVKNVLVLHKWASLPQSWTLMESTLRARVPGKINFLYILSGKPAILR